MFRDEKILLTDLYKGNRLGGGLVELSDFLFCCGDHLHL